MSPSACSPSLSSLRSAQHEEATFSIPTSIRAPGHVPQFLRASSLSSYLWSYSWCQEWEEVEKGEVEEEEGEENYTFVLDCSDFFDMFFIFAWR